MNHPPFSWEEPTTRFSPSFAEPDQDPSQIEYIEIKVKTALHHTRLPYNPKPAYYSLNLYRGCRHGCPYCFARYTHWYLGFQNSFDFERKIQVKVNLLEVLEKELAQPKRKRDWVSLGAATDPYQPAEKKYQLARGAFKLFAKYAWPAVFSTKSDLVVRDLDVLKEVVDRSNGGVANVRSICPPSATIQHLSHERASPSSRRARGDIGRPPPSARSRS